jgi:hypothetical protein
MNTRRVKRKGASGLGLMLLGTALALEAVFMLLAPNGTSNGIPGSKSWIRAGGERSTSAAEKKEQVQATETLQRRDFVTLRDIELVGSATASTAGVISPSRSNAAKLGVFLAWQQQIQRHEFQRFSQNGEDGIIQYIFCIPCTKRAT